MKGNEYISIVAKTIEDAWETQKEVLDAVEDRIVDTIAKKSNVYLFGCSHAGILAEEMFYRTGGLAVLNPIMFSGFMLNTRPITMTSKLERLPGLAKIILEENHLKSGDTLIIHSVSGRNTVSVEMAQEARKMGVFVIGITNLAYSTAVTSRAPDGKHLYEVCDAVIDNKGVKGDAAVHVDGFSEAIGPTSTAVGTAILNAIVVDVIEKLVGNNILPPVFMSANIDGGDEHNRRLFDEYGDNIFYM